MADHCVHGRVILGAEKLTMTLMHRSVPVLTLILILVCAPAGAQVINEFVANHTGTDTHEYVEVFGDPDTSYAHLTIVQIEGDVADGPGHLDSAIPVGTTDGAGYWWTGFQSNQYHNDNMSLLLVEGFSGTVGDDLDTNDDGTLDSTPWTAVVDEVGVKAQDSVEPGFVYTSFDLYPGTDGVWYTWGGGSRIPNGVDTDTSGDWLRNDWNGEGLPGFSGTLGPNEAVNTPGAENTAYQPRPPVINEVVADHTGADVAEYIEVFGETLADYSSYSLVILEGDVFDNPGQVDLVLAVGSTGGGASWWTGFLGSDSIEDGTKSILLVEGFSGLAGDDLDTDDNGVFDLNPWTSIADAIAFDDGDPGDVAYATVVLEDGFDGVAGMPGGASRTTSGYDSDTAADWIRNDFEGEGLGLVGHVDPGEALNTPGFANRRRLSDYYATVDDEDPASLRTTLHAVIDDHIRHEYTSFGVDTWDILEEAMEDPNNELNILDVYKNASYPKAGGGNPNYDREHSWPKSYGFSSNSMTNSPYTDTHHLFLCDGSYNSGRSNKPFATCDAACAEWTTDVNNNTGGGSGTYPGNSNWSDGSRWETWIHRRGDVARAVMYMAIRYEGGTHSVTGFDEPDLVLTDDPGLIQMTSSSPAYMGLLSDLLEWHSADPVDRLERDRTEEIWRHQGNRNPFVDHPSWAECLFAGTNCGGIFADGFEGADTMDWSGGSR